MDDFLEVWMVILDIHFGTVVVTIFALYGFRLSFYYSNIGIRWLQVVKSVDVCEDNNLLIWLFVV